MSLCCCTAAGFRQSSETSNVKRLAYNFSLQPLVTQCVHQTVRTSTLFRKKSLVYILDQNKSEETVSGMAASKKLLTERRV